MGSVGGESVHEIDDHSQSKNAGLNHVLFVLVHLLLCSCLYIFEVWDHRHMIAWT